MPLSAGAFGGIISWKHESPSGGIADHIILIDLEPACFLAIEQHLPRLPHVSGSGLAEVGCEHCRLDSKRPDASRETVPVHGRVSAHVTALEIDARPVQLTKLIEPVFVIAALYV